MLSYKLTDSVAPGVVLTYIWGIGKIAPSGWVESSKNSFALGQNDSSDLLFSNLKGKNSIFSPNYEMFFVNLKFIGQNGILQDGSFANFRGDHTYQIFEEVPSQTMLRKQIQNICN